MALCDRWRVRGGLEMYLYIGLVHVGVFTQKAWKENEEKETVLIYG